MRVVIGGQLGKEEIRACVESSGVEGLSVEVKDDVSAAMDIKQGRADYYLGACLTGGGGALAMAIAILGYDACKTLDSADVVLRSTLTRVECEHSGIRVMICILF